MPNIQTVAEIIEILGSGAFDPLIGTVETLHVEAKGEPYKLTSSDWQKQELAKDVSALANASGGIILVGFRTVKGSLTSVEEIECCRPFEPSLFDLEQYRNVLQSWIHPPIHSVQIVYYESASDPGKGVAAIIVPPEVCADKPYVVSRAVALDGKAFGALIGYFERVVDRIPTTSVGTLRSQLKDGMRFAEFSDRLSGIEVMLSERLPPVGEPSTSPTDQIAERVVEAQNAVGRIGQPNFVLAAASVSKCLFPHLFESRSTPVVKLLERPPTLREHGFAIRVPKQSSIIKGQLRRCLSQGHEIVDLWKDGTLVAVGPGDYDLLCWGREPRKDAGLLIRNFVLGEVALNFVQFAADVFKHAEPPPTRLRFYLWLENMTVDGQPCVLSSERDNRRFPRPGEAKTAPDSSVITSEVEISLEEFDTGRVVYELLAQVYAFFGFDHSDMPYVAEDDPKRITPRSMYITLGE